MKKTIFITILSVVFLWSCQDSDLLLKNYKVGDLYSTSNVKGIVVYVDSTNKHGLMMSLDETKTQWSTIEEVTGSKDRHDGLINSNNIINHFNINNYPAFKWCNSKNSNGITGWYLPAISEFDQILINKAVIQQSLSQNNGTILTVSENYNNCQFYWTSTEESSSYWADQHAETIESSMGYHGYDQKTDTLCVRAMRKF